ncbi:sugar porter family MFS transporter [Bifidobacterium tibiigranuli]|jgi:sugar porter (SP) family MFS transporter|uniref:sugar porter family MFS transporter n=1 Tax=Bifidobacterium tibiigranuli TaxID=2172043 RepID=UPI0026EEAFCA|nr:sugar porter family MFS transporter [Bifidobacterium tibiigranuli]MCI2184901.1 sugar porter family MFS transporter [Bifidobacterium tibiigranuli]MCI2204850.1 sugar porter family MFS transporter [Bifidobacterium tibiigranuli]
MSQHTAVTPDLSGGDSRGVIRIASVAALGGLLFGYDSAVINGAVSAIGEVWHIGAGALGFAVAAALIGAAIGAMTAGRVADRVGRLMVMKIAALLFILSAIGCVLASETTAGLVIFIVFRIIGGAGVGFASVIAPAYIAEVSPPQIRGRLGSLQQLAIVTGIFLSLLVDALLVHATSTGQPDGMLWFGLEAWRWMFLVLAVPAIIYGALAFTIPESPRYLVAAHRIPEARKVLTLLLGEKNLEITINRIQGSLAGETKPSWRDLKNSRTGKIYPIVWIGLIASMLQQFVGINVIFYYSNTLWMAVGFNTSSAFTISVITSIVNIATTIVAILLVDRIGRKLLLMIGSVGMTISLAVLAVCFGTAAMVPDATGQLAPVLNGASGPIALVSANVFVIAFGMSWGPVIWVLLGEMFPNRIRGAALSLAAAGQWVANWIVTVTFPGLKDISLGLAYGIYTGFALISLLFVAKFLTETKGRTLEDMDDALGEDRPAASDVAQAS